jgi:phospholipase/carboxylesterase
MKALILLHGRGGSSEDMFGLSKRFSDKDFIVEAPQAPQNAWYPQSFMVEEKLNEPQLSRSLEKIEKLIKNLEIPHDQIYLMGFSQGACLALEFAARHAEKYGGVVAFTGGLIGKTINLNKYRGNLEGTKVFIGTSEDDPYIPLTRAQESKEVLKGLGASVHLKVYPGASHTVTEEEIQWVKKNIFS